jgi:LPPG:FO 2-phospho-L-lactate transferase
MRFDGIEGAEMTPEVRQAIENAGVILIAPSNPWLSVAPILAVKGIRETILARDIPRVAITPIIGGKAVKGPAAKLMAELGYKASAETVANYYGDIINGYVYDSADAELDISTHRSIAMNTLMNTDADRAALAENVLNWIKDWK